MAFTRKMLKAMGIEDDKIEQIMDAHTEVTDALKEQRDAYKEDAEKLPGVQKELDDLKAAGDGDDYKKKYEDLVEANRVRDERAAKVAAFRKVAQEAGVAEKYIDTVIRASGDVIDKLEMDGDKIKGAEELTKSTKETWSDFVTEKETKGHKPDTPPTGGGEEDKDDLGQLSMEDYIAARNKM